MNCWSGRLLGALVISLSAVSASRADVITPWTYSWSSDPSPSLAADAPFGTGGINLLPSASAPGTHQVGDSDINAVNLNTFSSATEVADKFTSSPFSLTVHLTDLNSNQSGDLTFKGVFDGTLTATNSQIAATYLNPLTESIVLGQHKYSVALGTYVAPGDPKATGFGSIGAHVAITGDDGPGVTVQDVPEPSTLLLASLTLPAVGLGWWRTRGLRQRVVVCD